METPPDAVAQNVLTKLKTLRRNMGLNLGALRKSRLTEHLSPVMSLAGAFSVPSEVATLFLLIQALQNLHDKEYGFFPHTVGTRRLVANALNITLLGAVATPSDLQEYVLLETSNLELWARRRDLADDVGVHERTLREYEDAALGDLARLLAATTDVHDPLLVGEHETIVRYDEQYKVIELVVSRKLRSIGQPVHEFTTMEWPDTTGVTSSEVIRGGIATTQMLQGLGGQRQLVIFDPPIIPGENPRELVVVRKYDQRHITLPRYYFVRVATYGGGSLMLRLQFPFEQGPTDAHSVVSRLGEEPNAFFPSPSLERSVGELYIREPHPVLGRSYGIVWT